MRDAGAKSAPGGAGHRPALAVSALWALAAMWKRMYNHERPHSALGCRTPADFAAARAAALGLNAASVQDAAQCPTRT